MLTPQDLMTEQERDLLARNEGPTFTAFEWADRWLEAWRESHPNEERDFLEVLMSDDFPDALFSGR